MRSCAVLRMPMKTAVAQTNDAQTPDCRGVAPSPWPPYKRTMPGHKVKFLPSWQHAQLHAPAADDGAVARAHGARRLLRQGFRVRILPSWQHAQLHAPGADEGAVARAHGARRLLRQGFRVRILPSWQHAQLHAPGADEGAVARAHGTRRLLRRVEAHQVGGAHLRRLRLLGLIDGPAHEGQVRRAPGALLARDAPGGLELRTPAVRAHEQQGWVRVRIIHEQSELVGAHCDSMTGPLIMLGKRPG